MTGELGTLTLTGWVSGLEVLASIRQTYISMAPCTALAFTLLSLVLLLMEHPKFRRPMTELLLIAVGIVAGEKLFKFFSGVSLGIMWGKARCWREPSRS